MEHHNLLAELCDGFENVFLDLCVGNKFYDQDDDHLLENCCL
jgi:hypothetical protein